MIIETALDLPPHIAQGLASGIFKRFGGTIRDEKGRIVALLRDMNPSVDLTSIAGLSQLNLILGIANLGMSILNLGISVIGFGRVLNKIEKLEQNLQQTREVLLRSNQELAKKIHLSFYANFAAALKLARNSFTMDDLENRRSCAMQAINRFLEAEELYAACAKDLIESRARGAEQYLLSLAFAYIAETRCYLELEERGTAQYRLRESLDTLRPLIEEYIKILLTPNPSAYLHPELEDEVSLARLTRIYQWLESSDRLDENTVFQRFRKDFFNLTHRSDHWKNNLPDAVWEFIENKGIPGTILQLPALMDKIESLIETHDRLESYAHEIKVLGATGMSFQEWQNLRALPGKSTNPEVMFITLPEATSV